MWLALVCLSFLTQSHMLQVQPSLPNSKIIHWRICIWNTDKPHRAEAEPEIDRAPQSGCFMIRTVWMVDRRCSTLPMQLWAFLSNLHCMYRCGLWAARCLVKLTRLLPWDVWKPRYSLVVNANTRFQLSFTSLSDGIISLTLGHSACLESHVWALH